LINLNKDYIRECKKLWGIYIYLKSNVGSTKNRSMLQDLQDEKTAAASKEPFCKQKQHRKVLDKGVPEDVMPGIKNSKVFCSLSVELILFC
jgi:hypothetical protein